MVKQRVLRFELLLLVLRPILVFLNSSGNKLLKSFPDIVFIPLPFVDWDLYLTLLRKQWFFLKNSISPDIGILQCKVYPPLSSIFIATALFESSFDLGPVHANFNYFYNRSLLGLRILLKKSLLFTNSFLLLVVFVETQQHNRQTGESHLPVSYSFGSFELLREPYHVVGFELVEAKATDSIEMVIHYLLFSEMHSLETIILINHRLENFLPFVEVSYLLNILGNSCTVAELFQTIDCLLLKSVAPELIRYFHLLFDLSVFNWKDLYTLKNNVKVLSLQIVL